MTRIQRIQMKMLRKPGTSRRRFQGFTKTSYEHFGGAEGMADFDELD